MSYFRSRAFANRVARFFIAMFIVLAVCVAAFAWRMAQGPLSLNFAVPFVKDIALSSIAGAKSADVGDVVLTWNRQKEHLDVRIESVMVRNDKDEKIISAEHIDMGLAATPLLWGSVRFRTLNVVHPYALLYVGKDGHFGFAAGKDTAPAADHPDFNSWQKFFRAFQLSDAQLVLVDQQSGKHLDIVIPSITAKRNRKGLNAAAQIFLSQDDGSERSNTSMQGSASYDAAQNQTTGNLNFQNARVDNLSLLLAPFTRQSGSDLADLQRLKLPLNGALDFALDNKLAVKTAHLQLRGDKGEIDAAPYHADPVVVQNIMLNADYSGADKTAILHDFYGEIPVAGGMIPISLSGKLLKGNGLQARLALDKISVEQLKYYWPKDVAAGAINWINDNIDQGMITKAWVGLDATLKNQNLQLANVEGMFDVEDATVHYFGDYPKLTNLKGTGSFNADSFNIGIISADARDIKISDSRAIITGLNDNIQILDINATMTGPVRTVLQILDTPPYKFASKFGLDPNTSDGNAALRVRFALPMINALQDTELQFSAAGNFAKVGLKKILAGQDLTDTDATLSVDGDGLNMTGKGYLAGGAVDFNWDEHFANVSPKTDLKFKAAADDSMRKALDLPFANYFSGTVNAEGRYTSDSEKAADLALDLNLAPTAIQITDLNYSKPAGTAASGKMTIGFKNGKPDAARDIMLSGAGMNIKGSVVLESGKAIPKQLNLNPFIIGNTSAVLNITSPAKDERAIEFKGERFDASGLLGHSDLVQSAEPKARAIVKKPGGAEIKKTEDSLFKGLNVGINLGFNNVMLSKNQSLRNVGGGMRHDGYMWQVIDVDAALNPDGLMRIQWRPDNSGGRWLNIQANNAGAVLTGLGITDTIKGGMLSITGAGTGRLEPWIAEGNLSITDFKVVGAPALARLIALTSPTGLIDTFRGEGLSFGKLNAGFKFSEKQIVIEDGRTSGPSLGLSFQGAIDRDPEILHMRGTIVPLYAINSFLGNIPLIGDLLVGTKGDGVFSATYTIEGPASDPDVSVNPLSAFAPGFLRRILFENE